MKKVMLALTAYMMSFGTIAQNTFQSPGQTEFSVEIDPSTFGLKGYSVHLRVKPKKSDHFLFGVGTYAMNFPSVLVDFNKYNKDKGWLVRLNQGYGIFSEYHFSEINRKWYVGTQVALHEYEIEQDYYNGKSKFSTVLVMGLGGYTFQPFLFPLYFKLWGGVGYSAQVGGESTIGGMKYDVSPVMMFGALHIGYIINKN